MTDRPASSPAQEELDRAMRLHAEGRIDDALEAARQALELDPALADAHSYLGSTLVIRKGQHAEGLHALEVARDLAPSDPYVRYTLGWCYEYVAHEIEERRTRRPGFASARLLYDLAIDEFKACLRANPDDDLRDDVIKLLGHLGVDVDE